MSRMAGGESCRGFIHSKNLRATARFVYFFLSVMEVNFRMSRCNIFFPHVSCLYSISIFVYTIIFSVLFFEIKENITGISLFF